MPTLDLGEIAYQSDTKAGVIGDNTPEGAKFVTEKSTGTFDFTLSQRWKLPRVHALAGAVATPTITFPNGTNVYDTGFYGPAAGQIGVSLSGVSVATFASDKFTFAKRLVFTNTDGLKLPAGTNIQRTGTPGIGEIRLNTSVGTGVVEFYNSAGAWVTLSIASGVYFNNYGLSTGSSTAISVTTDDGATTLTDGMHAYVKMHTSLNAGATLNKNGTGDIAIQHNSGDAIANGDVEQGIVAHFVYDLALNVWRFLNPATVSGGGGGNDTSSGGVVTAFSTMVAGENLAAKDVVTMWPDGKLRYAISRTNDTYNDYRLRPVLLNSTAYNSFGTISETGASYTTRIDSSLEVAQRGDRFATAIGAYVVTAVITSNLRVGYVVTQSNGAPVSSAEITTQAFSAASTTKRSAPQVVRLGTNRFCIVWWGPSGSADTGTNTVHFAVYSVSSTGVVAQITAPTLITTVATGMHDYDIVRLSDGSVAVAWVVGEDGGGPTVYALGSAVIGLAGTISFAAATHTRTGTNAAKDEALVQPWQFQKSIQLCAFGDGSFVVGLASSLYTLGTSVSFQLHRISSGNSYLGRQSYNDVTDGTDTFTNSANFHLHSLPNGDVGFVHCITQTTTGSGGPAGQRVGVMAADGTLRFTLLQDVSTVFYITGGGTTFGHEGGCVRIYPLADNSVVLIKYRRMNSVGGIPGSTLEINSYLIPLVSGTYGAGVNRPYIMPAYSYTTLNADSLRFSLEIPSTADGLFTVVSGVDTLASPSTPARQDVLLRFDPNNATLTRYTILTENGSRYTNTMLLDATHPEYSDAGIHMSIAYQMDVTAGAQAARAATRLKVASLASQITRRVPIGVTSSSALANNNVVTQISGYVETRLTFAPGLAADGRLGVNGMPGQKISVLGNKALLIGYTDATSSTPILNNVLLSVTSGISASYTVPLGFYFKFQPRGFGSSSSSTPVFVYINGSPLSIATTPGGVDETDDNTTYAAAGDVITVSTNYGGIALITLMGFLIAA
jgi:hypothetical protein